MTKKNIKDLKISNILVSQPTPAIIEKSPFNDLMQKFKVKVTFNPFIKVEGVSLKGFIAQRVNVLDHTTIIFTTRAMIDNFFRICEEARVVIPDTMKYLCNTETVALYMQKYIVYRKRKISFADGTFSNFMELIIKHKNEKLLLTLADPYKPEVPNAMEKLKLNFSKIILSKTVSADLSHIKMKDYDLLVFYSPNEIATLVSEYGTEHLPMIATFGEGTTRAALNAGICVNVMAPTPAAPSMSKALELFLIELKAGKTTPVVAEILENKNVDEFIKAQEAKMIKKPRAKRVTTTK